MRLKEYVINSLMNLTSDGIVIVDLNGVVLEVNTKFEELHGWTREEAIGQVLPMTPDEYKEDALRLYQSLINGEQIRDFETLKLRKDGSTFYASVTVSPVKDSDGVVIGFVGVERDISEKKKAEETMIRSEKLALIGQLAAGIAHDIRNPLTSLKGFVQLLKYKNTDYVDVMMEELEHINYVVNEFMMLAKPHLSHYIESRVIELVQSIISFLQPHALLYNVQIQLEMDPEIPVITCIPDQIKQVLINVLKNAIESMESGGEIQITCRNRLNQDLIICVKDQGIGISAEKLAQLGEPFFTTKANGTGLGLMVCKRIVEAHGGKLSILSLINQGTTVEIALPINSRYHI
ncbi:ATP-binding protein [Paenibacillus sp. 2RAB27]|uniref:ATP-binding protein n=1 Tax=Paenibacillus sp. 2RAB27 TaxID=3232991 RepID=UPI003F9E0979